MFLSHTSELRRYPPARSFVAAAEQAVSRAGGRSWTWRIPRPGGQARGILPRAGGPGDVYVGLIGFRYGSPVRDEPELSYTELEFDAATELGLPRLVFLLDEDAELPLPRTFLTDPVFGERQRAFRARVQGRRDNGPARGVSGPAGDGAAPRADRAGQRRLAGDATARGGRHLTAGQAGWRCGWRRDRNSCGPGGPAGRAGRPAGRPTRDGAGGRGVVRAGRVRARPAWRWSTRTGTWPGCGVVWQLPAEDRPRWRLGSASWPRSWALGRRRG